MKTTIIIFLICFFSCFQMGFGQTVIQSTCKHDSTEYSQAIEDFAYEIALSEMKNKNHCLHDSILVPQLFLDSIKQFVAAYHNAIALSDSIVDYRKFNDSRLESGAIFLTFDNLSNCISQQNNSTSIKNDTLAAYVDSLGLNLLIESENQVAVYDPNYKINIYGAFNFFYNVSCITNVELILAVADQGLCYTSRSGAFRGDKLYLNFSDVNYCDSNAYAHRWEYVVTSDCKIEIRNVFTNTTEILNGENPAIYPNPFDERIYIEPNGQTENIRLIGADGQLCRQSLNNNLNYFETNDLPPGIYLIEIKFKNGNTTVKKLIKK